MKAFRLVAAAIVAAGFLGAGIGWTGAKLRAEDGPGIIAKYVNYSNVIVFDDSTPLSTQVLTYPKYTELRIVRGRIGHTERYRVRVPNYGAEPPIVAKVTTWDQGDKVVALLPVDMPYIFVPDKAKGK